MVSATAWPGETFVNLDGLQQEGSQRHKSPTNSGHAQSFDGLTMLTRRKHGGCAELYQVGLCRGLMRVPNKLKRRKLFPHLSQRVQNNGFGFVKGAEVKEAV